MRIVIPHIAALGVAFINATPVELMQAGVTEVEVLAAVKPLLKAEIDAAAEAARLALITGGVGQAMEYAEADAQAAAALKAPTAATPAKYPMLAASIGIDFDPSTGAPATDVLGVARGVTAARDAWNLAGAEIRRARLATKAAIDAASTFAEAADAVASVSWPTR